MRAIVMIGGKMEDVAVANNLDKRAVLISTLSNGYSLYYDDMLVLYKEDIDEKLQRLLLEIERSLFALTECKYGIVYSPIEDMAIIVNRDTMEIYDAVSIKDCELNEVFHRISNKIWDIK